MTKSDELTEQAYELIAGEYHLLAGVDDLADRLGVSKCHLIRCFTARYGHSPGKSLINTRIAAACNYLRSSEYTVDAIAGLTGFACGNYMAKVFRRVTGLTPTQYRATHSGGNLPSAPARNDDIYYV